MWPGLVSCATDLQDGAGPCAHKNAAASGGLLNLRWSKRCPRLPPVISEWCLLILATFPDGSIDCAWLIRAG